VGGVKSWCESYEYKREDAVRSDRQPEGEPLSKCVVLSPICRMFKEAHR